MLHKVETVRNVFGSSSYLAALHIIHAFQSYTLRQDGTFFICPGQTKINMIDNSEQNINTDTPSEPAKQMEGIATPSAEETVAQELETPNHSEELTSSEVATDMETPSEGTEISDSEPLQAVETSQNDPLQQLASMTEANSELLQQLVRDFDTKLKYDATKQEQIDKLYNENQEYKQGIHEKLKKSLVLTVIGQIDAAQKTIFHFGNQEFTEENYRKLLDNYSEIATDFQDSLAQSFDVTAFGCEENTPFDAKRQKALKTIATEDESKHKTICQSLRQGYEMVNADGTTTLLRLEMVEVYVYQTSQAQSTNN